jgi:hypothetical protein
VHIDGAPLADLAAPVRLAAGRHPVLVRYDQGGRGHFVLRRHGAPPPAVRTKLAMRWHDDPAVLPFDVAAGPGAAEWFRFLSAPGTKAIEVDARGKVQAWLDGKPMADRGGGRFEAAQVPARAAVVALRVAPEPGWSGGAALGEPVAVETDGSGRMAAGDWSRLGILHNYSGGVLYGNSFTLTAEEAAAKVELDLGRVVATAGVTVNGRQAGVRVAPPWTFDLTGLLRPGANRIEVLVYNTLSNHYQTIPSNYRGDPASGLFGPVRLRSPDWERGDAAMVRAGVRVAVRRGTAAQFRAAVADPAARRGLAAAARGSRSHDGGGGDFSALFNGTAGNPAGGDVTANDGRTFVGFGAGDTLDLDLGPRGVEVRAVRTYSGHHDGRATQRYRLLAATAAAPDEFVPLAEVAAECPGGVQEVDLTIGGGGPPGAGIRRLRFEFEDGPVGFNVYREIVVIGPPGG